MTGHRCADGGGWGGGGVVVGGLEGEVWGGGGNRGRMTGVQSERNTLLKARNFFSAEGGRNYGERMEASTWSAP